jgi:hypothetical protein
MNSRVSGFDWDEGNRAKCQKHGVSIPEIEELFAQGPSGNGPVYARQGDCGL